MPDSNADCMRGRPQQHHEEASQSCTDSVLALHRDGHMAAEQVRHLACLLLCQRHYGSQEQYLGLRVAPQHSSCRLDSNPGLAAACGGHNNVVLPFVDARQQLLLIAVQGAVGPANLFFRCLPAHVSLRHNNCDYKAQRAMTAGLCHQAKRGELEAKGWTGVGWTGGPTRGNRSNYSEHRP